MRKVRERMIPDQRMSAFWLKQHIGRYVFAAQFVNGTILDIACGNGYGSSYLIHKGAKTVVGGDYSGEAIEYARCHYSKDGLYFLRLDAQQLPFRDNSFDVIVSLETIEHLEKYKDFLQDCRRVLKEDGIFVCSTPNANASFGSRDPYHFREFSVDELHEQVARYFAEVKLYGQDFLTRADMLKRELLWRLTPIAHSIPQSIQTPLRKLLFPGNYLVSLVELEVYSKGGGDEIVEDKYIPSPLMQSYPIPATMVAVSKKRRGSG